MNKNEVAEMMTKADSAMAYIQYMQGRIVENISDNNAAKSVELAQQIQSLLRELRMVGDI